LLLEAKIAYTGTSQIATDTIIKRIAKHQGLMGIRDIGREGSNIDWEDRKSGTGYIRSSLLELIT
jgi:hypothetical protein